MMASRAVLLALAFAACLPGAAGAQTPGLVVDAGTGRVIFAERASDPWHPASITKLMTVYVALDQVRAGRAQMDTLLTMSETAAAQPPSKIGLKPGMTMRLDNALKIIMVKSANDIATMIGENLGGGSVEGFAEMMNGASRRLGMHTSRWYNPSGLPDDRQQTSARDMAILARALIREFPEHDALFRIGAVKLGRSVMRNHNGLLGRYPGVDGMKTGFICSSGFNVVATSTQNGRRIIAVAMGYPSARERDLRVADLFDMGFGPSLASWTAPTVENLPPSALMSPPNLRPMICGGGKKRQPKDDDEPAAVASSNAENPISGLFAPVSLAAAVPDVARLGTRRELGPRLAFEPEVVWLGAKPGDVADEGVTVRGRRSRIASRSVRTQRVASRASAAGPKAQAFASGAATPSIVAGGGGKVETVASRPSPASRAALRAGLDPKPAAEAKPGRKVAAKAPEGLNPDKAKKPAGTKKAAAAARD